MGQALHISNGLVSQIGSNILTLETLDRTSAGTLVLGGANATTVTLGGNAATTTINIGTGAGAAKTINIGAGPATTSIVLDADVTVKGAEIVEGNSTFEGNIILGDAPTDTITFVGRVASDILFEEGSAWTIGIAGDAADAHLTIRAGSSTSGDGSNLYLRPGSGLADPGSIYFGGLSGGTGAGHFQILADTADATNKAGIRYNADTNAWQLRLNASALWENIAAGGAMPSGTEYQLMRCDSGTTWEPTNDVELPAGADRNINVRPSTTGVGRALIVAAGASAGVEDVAGGTLTLRSGVSGGSGSSSSSGAVWVGSANSHISGDVRIATGASATSDVGQITVQPGDLSGTATMSGQVTVQGGTANGVARTGGTVTVRGGSGTGGGTGGQLVIEGGSGSGANSGGTLFLRGGVGDDFPQYGAIRMHRTVHLFNDGGEYARVNLHSMNVTHSNNLFATGTRFTDSGDIGMVWQTKGVVDTPWLITAEDEPTFVGTGMQLRGADGAVGGGRAEILGGTATAGVGGIIRITAGTSGGSNAGARVDITAGTASGGDNNGGHIQFFPGNGSGTGVRGSVVYGPVNVAIASAYQILANTNATDATKAGLRYNHDAGVWQYKVDGGLAAWTDFGSGSVPNGTINSQILQWDHVGTAWVVSSNLYLPAASAFARIIGIESGDDATMLQILGQDGLSGNNHGGEILISGGAPAGTGDCGHVRVIGGATPGTGAAGNVYIAGGTRDSGASNGHVLLATETAGNVYMGHAGVTYAIPTNGIQFVGATRVFQAIGTGAINLDTTNSRLQINGGAVTHHANMTAANFATLFNGGDATALHTHGGAGDLDLTGDGASVNDLVYVSNTGPGARASLARANAAATARCVGVYVATDKVRQTKEAIVAFTDVSGGDPGDPVWLSAGTAGRATLTAPTSSGEYQTFVGYLKTAVAANAATVVLQPARPIAL